MTAAEACLKLVQELPVSSIQSLIEQLRSSANPALPNPAYQGRVDEFIRAYPKERQAFPWMLEVAIAAKLVAPTTDLVWTGPPTTVVPRRGTEQVLFEVIQRAERKLTLMSFGIFQVPRIVNALEEALLRAVDLRIVLGDRETERELAFDRQRRELGAIISKRALLLQWCPERRIRDEHGHAGLMHAKVAIADARVVFMTSANLTEAALERNIEIGILISGGQVPSAIDRLLDELIQSGEMKPV